jgi:REP element-mobilizing transposase RayT
MSWPGLFPFGTAHRAVATTKKTMRAVATGLWPVRDSDAARIPPDGPQGRGYSHDCAMDEPRTRRYNDSVAIRFKYRSLRLGRVFVVTPLYFVTFCTHERRRWLHCDAVHTAFVHFARRAHEQFNIAVGRYVIMPDHVHLFVRGPDDFVLGRWIGSLKQALAKALGFSRSCQQIWQEGFF